MRVIWTQLLGLIADLWWQKHDKNADIKPTSINVGYSPNQRQQGTMLNVSIVFGSCWNSKLMSNPEIFVHPLKTTKFLPSPISCFSKQFDHMTPQNFVEIRFYSKTISNISKQQTQIHIKSFPTQQPSENWKKLKQ